MSFNVYCYTLAPIKLFHLSSRECSVQHTSNISWVWILHWASWGAARSLSGPLGIKLCQHTLFCCRGNGYKWSLSWRPRVWLYAALCQIIFGTRLAFNTDMSKLIHARESCIYLGEGFGAWICVSIFSLASWFLYFCKIFLLFSYGSPYCYKYKLQSKHCLTSIIILTWGKLTNSQRKD